MVDEKILVDIEEVKEMFKELVSDNPSEEEWIEYHNNFIALATVISDRLGHKIDDPHYIRVQQHTVH